MAIPSEDYLEVAKRLRVGGSVRVEHTCGGGRTLKVSRPSVGEFRAWCFRCSQGGVTEENPSLQDMLSRLAPNVYDMPVPVPPVDSQLPISEWPKDAKLWLYKSGFSNKDIKALGAYWSAEKCRVVIPLPLPIPKYQAGYIARAVLKQQSPKYMSYVDHACRRPVCYGKLTSSRIIVLVEDALSAYKVASRAGVMAWPLLGTSLRDYYLEHLVRLRPDKVVLWVDPDKGGDKARARILPTLYSVGLNVVEVHSSVDPKKLSKEAICKLIFT